MVYTLGDNGIVTYVGSRLGLVTALVDASDAKLEELDVYGIALRCVVPTVI